MSKTFSRIAANTLRIITSVQRPERAERNRLMIRELLTERHTLNTEHGVIILSCTGPRETHYARHFFDREPDTLVWIDSFETPCTFWDIGANIGIYSLYAALNTGVDVFAFEPGAANYAALCSNIHVNSADERITALCIGFYDQTTIGELRMNAVDAGSAMHRFGRKSLSGDKKDGRKFLERTLSFTIDDFCDKFNLSPPNYLKVDVDSVEEQIILGAAKSLAGPSIRSILIEVQVGESEVKDRISVFLKSYGFEAVPLQGKDENVLFNRP